MIPLECSALLDVAYGDARPLATAANWKRDRKCRAAARPSTDSKLPADHLLVDIASWCRSVVDVDQRHKDELFVPELFWQSRAERARRAIKETGTGFAWSEAVRKPGTPFLPSLSLPSSG
jgi:hypothetical protein